MLPWDEAVGAELVTVGAAAAVAVARQPPPLQMLLGHIAPGRHVANPGAHLSWLW